MSGRPRVAFLGLVFFYNWVPLSFVILSIAFHFYSVAWFPMSHTVTDNFMSALTGYCHGKLSLVIQCAEYFTEVRFSEFLSVSEWSQVAPSEPTDLSSEKDCVRKWSNSCWALFHDRLVQFSRMYIRDAIWLKIQEGNWDQLKANFLQLNLNLTTAILFNFSFGAIDREPLTSKHTSSIDESLVRGQAREGSVRHS